MAFAFLVTSEPQQEHLLDSIASPRTKVGCNGPREFVRICHRATGSSLNQDINIDLAMLHTAHLVAISVYITTHNVVPVSFSEEERWWTWQLSQASWALKASFSTRFLVFHSW